MNDLEQQVPIHLRSIRDLDISVRAQNALISENIRYVGDLVRKSDIAILKIPNLGRKCIAEIRAALADHGLALAEHVWPSQVPKKLQGEPLTIDRIEALWQRCSAVEDRTVMELIVDFARSIERHHGVTQSSARSA